MDLSPLRERLNLSYLRRLLSTSAGRAHVLAQMADAEASGEARVFDAALARVQDPELQRLIGKHRDDEIRHEALFRAQYARNSTSELRVPPELRLIDKLDRELGSLLSREVVDDQGVLEAYSLLQVLEERAVITFGLFIRAFAEVDQETAGVFAEVLEDEKRHLKYCVAIARRYAGSEEQRLAALERARKAEAKSFEENQLANMGFTLGHGLMGGLLETLPWRALRLLVQAVHPAPITAAELLGLRQEAVLAA